MTKLKTDASHFYIRADWRRVACEPPTRKRSVWILRISQSCVVTAGKRLFGVEYRLLRPIVREAFSEAPAMTNTPDRDSRPEGSQTQSHYPSFSLVGLGASAGGIKAFQTFFDNMPPDSGMAFVVVMHLAPDYESNLMPVLQQRTRMPVQQVTETTTVVPNHVYVIPPNKHLS